MRAGANCDCTQESGQSTAIGTDHPKLAIVDGVPRTDENGRQLKALLGYLLDGDVEAQEIFDALGISSSTYYRRVKEADYPDAEDLRKIADRFKLNYLDLQIRFGLLGHHDVERYLTSGPSPVATVAPARTARRMRRLAELQQRPDAPSL